MKIIIETIEHKDQRYPTPGDWFYDPDGTLHITASNLSTWQRTMAVALHELVEALICKHDGVEQARVDSFDKNYPASQECDPGDDPKAPYFRGHQVGTIVEEILIMALDDNFPEYAKEVDALV